MQRDPVPQIPQGVVRFYNFLAGDPFLDEVLAGFSRHRKGISTRFLFDGPGAKFYAALCQQPEHFQVRAEVDILRDNVAAIAQFVGEGTELIELRTGIGVQAAMLSEGLRPLVYVPIDIDAFALQTTSREIAEVRRELNIAGMRADFLAPMVLPEFAGLPIRKKVVFLPGGLIGRFVPDQACTVLRQARRLAGTGGVLIAGVDLPIEPRTLEAAYSDADGACAAWHLNALARVNRELGGDLQPGRFSYHARYDATLGRTTMRLESRFSQFARIAGRRFDFAPGEAIDAGVACQYAQSEFQALARQAGFAPEAVWTDSGQQFSVHGMIAI